MASVNILIVEDEFILSMDLAHRLTQMGYHVIDSADNGPRALAIYQQQPVDLVLLDIHIAGEWDGIETARRMSQVRQVPLIFLTAITDPATIGRARLVSPAAYLTKPFTDLNLRITIDLAIHNAGLHLVAPDSGVGQPAAVPELAGATTGPDAAELAKGEIITLTSEFVFIKQNYRFVKFRPAELLYLQSDGNYTDLITNTHKYTLRLVLNKVLEKFQVPEALYSDLVRIHRSYAVNVRQIDSFSENEVLVGQHALPIGRSYRSEFIKKFEFM